MSDLNLDSELKKLKAFLKQPDRFYRRIKENITSIETRIEINGFKSIREESFNINPSKNFEYFFQTHFNTTPSSIQFYGNKKEEVVSLILEKYSEVITDISFQKDFSPIEGFIYSNIIFILNDSLTVEISSSCVVLLFNSSPEDIVKVEDFEKEISRIFRQPQKSHSTYLRLILFQCINLWSESSDFYYFQEAFQSKKSSKINLKLNYNEDFAPISHLILDKLKSESSGVVYLFGKSGTGKTYYIKYLASLLKRNIVYVPHRLVRCLAEKKFIKYMRSISNSILIVEDIELMNLENKLSLYQVIVDFTDKVIVDDLNIQLICTSQTDVIDSPQLERKGRMIAKYEFKELSAEKTKILCNKLGFGFGEELEPMTLADIYYKADPKRIIEVNKETEVEEKAPF